MTPQPAKYFHPMKEDPSKQFIAHHFCHQLRDDLMQCVLYDGNQADSKLIGIEYIIPQEVYQKLPQEEQQYWHPHNFEILSGQLVAPEVLDDMKLLAAKINSYGKTWHTWEAGIYGQEADSLPFGISMEEKRQQRQKYIEQAEPQCGMNAIVDKFEGPIKPLPRLKAREDC